MAFQLQILHAADAESGIPALEDAINFSTVVNALRDDYANTIILSSGDNYIPGPFFSSASDASLRKTAAAGAGYTFREGVGRVDIEILNQIGVQASAFGNHEFDLGESTVVSLIAADREYRGTTFPYLSSNLTFTDPTPATNNNDVLEDFVVPDGQAPQPNSIARSTVLTVNGEQVGVVGATTPTLKSISSPGSNVLVDPADFASNPTPAQLDALAAEIQGSVDALVNAGINKIVLLAHMQQISIERELAKRLRNVDVIIAGGSNTLLADSSDRLRPGDTVDDVYPLVENSPTGPVLVLNTDGNWKYVGRLVAEFDDNGVIDLSKLDPAINGAYATDAASVAALTATNPASPDPEVVDLVNALKTVISSKDGNTFGRTTVFLNGRRDDVRTQETNLGNLTADANLFYAKQVDSSVVISIKNGGGIRDNIGTITAAAGSTDPNDFEFLPPPANALAGKDEGEVSQLDVENSLRFNNALSLITVTAAQLKEVLEHAVSGVRPGATPGSFPQIGGVSFSFDATKTAQVLATDGTVVTPGNRIQSVSIKTESGRLQDVIVRNGQIVGDPNRTFRVVTLNFLLGTTLTAGGDNYPFFRFVRENPTLANRVDLQGETTIDLNRNGVIDAAVPLAAGVATFAAAGSEQDAFAEYLAQLGRSFDEAEVGPESDRRIQNLAFRNDGIFNEAITGNRRGNVLRGRFGSDTISGLAGNDQLLGRAGDDVLLGGNGNDRLDGGNGADTLISGGGLDRVKGGQGRDTFVLQTGPSFDVIEDYRDGVDKLGLAGNLRFNNLALRQLGANVQIRTRSGDVLALVKDINVSVLRPNDFTSSFATSTL